MITYADIVLGLKNTTHNKTGNITDLRSAINTAVTNVLNDVKLRSTKRITDIPYSVHSEIKRYACPADILGTSIVEIRKQNNYQGVEWIKTDTRNFFKENKTNYIAIDQSLQRKSILMNATNSEFYTVIDTLEDYDDNGTWTASSDAYNVTNDTFNYLEGNGSVSFDINSGATTATIYKTALTSVDLSTYSTSGDIYLNFFAPVVSGLNSITLKWGSSSSDYYSKTITATAESLAFITGWNLLKFNRETATETGTVVDTAIDYLELTLNKDASMAATTGFKVNYMIYVSGELYQTVYYSKYPWISSTGTLKETSTLNSDILSLEGDETSLVISRINFEIAQQLRETNDINYWKTVYNEQKNVYISNNKDESMLEAQSYYTF